MKLGSIINAQQFTKEEIQAIFAIAGDMMIRPARDLLELLKGRVVITLFYESSTRTRLSFESATLRLGGNVIGTESAKLFSSKSKGETLEDSIQVVSTYGDVIILRYHKEGGAERAAKYSRTPIINAGDGIGQHPTQALLDVYTIQQRYPEISGLNIAMVGDLENGRTVHSDVYLLGKHYPNNTFYFISPKQTRMKPEIKEYLNRHNVRWVEVNDLKSVAGEMDVIYQTRVQKERFEECREIYDQVMAQSEKLIINNEILSLMKKDAIIMHPLPRVNEIAYEVDRDERAWYFKQAENGLYIRMALLIMMMNGY